MPICGECGTNTTSKKFCGECGAKITANAALTRKVATSKVATSKVATNKVTTSKVTTSKVTTSKATPSKVTTSKRYASGDVPVKFQFLHSSKPIRCMASGKEFSGRYLKVNNNTYHSPSFQCCQCSKEIATRSTNNTFMMRNGDPWCNICIEWDKKNKKESKLDAPSLVSPEASTDKANSICPKCKKMVTKNQLKDSIELPSGLHHIKCTKCVGCGNKLDAVIGFKETSKGIYHPNCIPKNTDDVCVKCDKVVIGKFVKKKKKKWHPDCFVCEDCGTNLQGKGSITLRGKLLCGPCAKKSMGKKNVQIVRGNQKTGTQTVVVAKKNTR